jgi:5,10-methylenetetrahydromethanopterin reductase
MIDFGLCFASQISDIDYIVEAEKLGFADAWFGDSQMIWSDCYACLAIASQKTKKINLGTGVAVAGTRPPSVHASAIASINQLAPGRTFFGVGSGNTAMRIMGLPPMRIKKFDRFLKEVKPLLSGKESLIDNGKSQKLIKHIMQEDGFVNFKDHIPIYISGFGPKSLALAGKYGNGAIISLPPSSGVMKFYWSMIEQGASLDTQKNIKEDFTLTALTAISILDEGEKVDSDRVKTECGPMAMASVHYAYDQWRNFNQEPPEFLKEMWPDYITVLSKIPKKRIHQRIHAGHNCWVLPEEEKFLNTKILESTCLIGTKDNLIERLREFHTMGLDKIMILPGLKPRYEVIKRISQDLIGNI